MLFFIVPLVFSFSFLSFSFRVSVGLKEPLVPSSPIFIKNAHCPLCVNCVHFLRGKPEWSTSQTTELMLSSRDALCKKFGHLDVVSGEVHLKYASTCREYDHLCGNEGKYFNQNNVSFVEVETKPVAPLFPLSGFLYSRDAKFICYTLFCILFTFFFRL